MSKKNRRPQAQKRLDSKVQKVLDLRRGSRTSPVPSGKAYVRKPKHGSWN